MSQSTRPENRLSRLFLSNIRRSKTSAALLVAGTFLLGGITGAVSYSLYRTHVQAASPKAAGHAAVHDIVEELSKGLRLDEAQKEKLTEIVRQSRERYRALSRQFRPQYEAIRKETRQEMSQILREDQKARFEEIMRDIDSRHKSRGPRPSR